MFSNSRYLEDSLEIAATLAQTNAASNSSEFLFAFIYVKNFLPHTEALDSYICKYARTFANNNSGTAALPLTSQRPEESKEGD